MEKLNNRNKMGHPYKGEVRWQKLKVDQLADELKAWLGEWDDEEMKGNWDIREFATKKGLPFKGLFDDGGYFCKKSAYFRLTMLWALEVMEIRFRKLVRKEKVTGLWAGLEAKNLFSWKDKQEVSETRKKGKKIGDDGIKEALSRRFKRP